MVKNLYLSVLVFVSGAAVLAIEMLGTRVLGPFYGVSLFLWSALITVTLVALSVGYAVGGRWADRGASLVRLCSLLLAVGAWLFLVPWLRGPVLSVSEPLGLRYAVLVAAFLLFAPPLTLLGMVSPYAIRLRATSLGEVGRTAGDLYAISTIGSVVAALATGFFLIPYVGVGRLTALVGALLLVVGLVGFLLASRFRTAGVAAVVLLPAAFLCVGATRERADPEHGLLSVEESPYAQIRVVDSKGSRFLIIDGGTHTIVDASTFESYFPYVHVIDLLNHVVQAPGDLLLIGLGGGSVAKSFARQGWRVDAVEIDPVVTAVARRDFGLEDSEARIVEDDGRHYLASTAKRYQAIVLDAFGSSSIPFHLVTREAFALAAEHLEPGGILAVNVECIGWDDVLVRSLSATLAQDFAHVAALPIAEPPDQLGNLVFFASQDELELVHPIPRTPDRFSSIYDQNHAWDNRFTPDPKGAPVLTDDRNPVDLWSERINRVERRDLHDYFASGLSF